jgi:hypothetical protein
LLLSLLELLELKLPPPPLELVLVVVAANDEDIMVGLLVVLACLPSTIRRRPPSLSSFFLCVLFCPLSVLAGRRIVCPSHSVKKYRIRLSVSRHLLG